VAAAYGKAQADVWQSDAGKPSGLVDPFNPPQPKGPAGPGGMAVGGGQPTTSSEQTKDIIEALAEYARTARVYSRGRLVVVEGRIPHGNPETGVFEKFWQAISSKFQVQQPGMGGFGPGGGMPGMGPPPGMAPPPPGPGR
jgi:hypothetical protein